MPGSTMSHEALLFDSDEQFLVALTPFLSGAVRRGQAAVAAVTSHHIDLLRAELGEDGQLVTFIDRDAWYQRPAATLAGWTALLNDALARGQGAIRIVGEPAFGERPDTWMRYESAINAVFADFPAWIVCPYDTWSLPDSVLTDIRRTHPVVAPHGVSPHYQEPDELLRKLPEPLPPVTGPPAATVVLTAATGLRQARQAVVDAARAYDWDRTRVEEILLVVTEIAVNGLIHGRGVRCVHVWTGPEALTCEVLDNGDGVPDPLAPYRPGAPCPDGSRGLWLANQLCDWLAIEHRDGTTRVRFRFDR